MSERCASSVYACNDSTKMSCNAREVSAVGGAGSSRYRGHLFLLD